MSDIPIGSPPAPPGRHAAPRGWYPDPVDGSRERYWDGWGWSRNTRAAETAQGTGAAQPAAPGHQSGPQSYRPSYPQRFDHPYDPRAGSHPPFGQPGQQPAYQPHPGVAGQAVTGPVTADGVPLAAWGWRFLSAVIDLIIVSIVGSVLALPVTLQSLPAISRYVNEVMAAAEAGRIAPPLDVGQVMSTNQQMLVAAISVVVGVLYFLLFWRFRAATPGQLACGLRVVPDGRGRTTERLGWAQAAIRALVWSVPFMVGNPMLILFGVLNALFPLWNVKRQAIHDLAAKTQLVKIR